ncbi:MAG: hypothetical protein ACTSRW_04195 [Candidatus Helarchaeota archaeon]
MEPPENERYLTNRIIIILCLTGMSTFITSFIFYLIIRTMFPGLLMLIRPDIWLYFINIGMATVFGTRQVILDRTRVKSIKALIFIGIKFMILYSLLFPIFSDLIGHLILEYQPSYLYMYSTFVAILALLTFPVALFDRIDQLLPIIPLLVFFYFSGLILQTVDDIVMYQAILVISVGFILTIEVFIYILGVIILHHREKPKRRSRT